MHVPPIIGFLALSLVASTLPVQTDSVASPQRTDSALAARQPAVGPTPSSSDSGSRRSGSAIATSPSWCQPGAEGRRVAQSLVGGAFVAGNVVLHQYFKGAWWSGEKAPKFFLNYDWNGPFLDMDKLGHMLGGYMLSETGATLLKQACMSKTQATLWSVAHAAAFQLQIELWDATQKQYGFSPPDMLFNTIGQGLYLVHAFVPGTQAFTPSMSYSPTQAVINVRDGKIPGDLRATVDYSGQTYWMSVDVDTLLHGRAKKIWPSFLRVSVGTTITDWINPNTGDIMRARRRFLMSLDLDPLKLPGQKPWWVNVKTGLRHYHFPSPALEYGDGKVRLVAWKR